MCIVLVYMPSTYFVKFFWAFHTFDAIGNSIVFLVEICHSNRNTVEFWLLILYNMTLLNLLKHPDCTLTKSGWHKLIKLENIYNRDYFIWVLLYCL